MKLKNFLRSVFKNINKILTLESVELGSKLNILIFQDCSTLGKDVGQ